MNFRNHLLEQQRSIRHQLGEKKAEIDGVKARRNSLVGQEKTPQITAEWEMLTKQIGELGCDVQRLNKMLTQIQSDLYVCRGPRRNITKAELDGIRYAQKREKQRRESIKKLEKMKREVARRVSQPPIGRTHFWEPPKFT